MKTVIDIKFVEPEEGGNQSLTSIHAVDDSISISACQRHKKLVAFLFLKPIEHHLTN